MKMNLWVKHEDGWAGTLVLQDGALSGEPLAVQAIQAAADASDDGLAVTPAGPFFPQAQLLTDPVALWLLAQQAFVGVDVQRDGDDPQPLLDGLMYPEGTDADTVF